MQWSLSVVPALGRLRQEDQEFKDKLSFVALPDWDRLHSKPRHSQTNKQTNNSLNELLWLINLQHYFSTNNFSSDHSRLLKTSAENQASKTVCEHLFTGFHLFILIFIYTHSYLSSNLYK